MGHSISKAAKQRGKKAENPSWCGWVYLVKTSRLQAQVTWKRRYCRITDDKLLYFRDDSPSKGSKGWVSLLDMSAMVHLPFRRGDPALDDAKSSIVPFLLLSSTSTFVVGFGTAVEKDEFANHLATHHRIPFMPVITEDWSIVQLNLSSKAMPASSSSSSSKPFLRLYLVFVGSGDLLFFAEGAVLMDIVFRVRMLEMENVVVEYDGAAGNGLAARLSPRSRRAPAASPLDGPTIDVILPMEKAVRLEFDAVAQYEKWRELLVDALEGDYTGSQFSQRQAVAARRKHLHRQQKMDAMKKKHQRAKHGGRPHQLRASSAIQRASESDDGSGVRASVSRTASSIDYSEWSGVALSDVESTGTDDVAALLSGGRTGPIEAMPSETLTGQVFAMPSVEEAHAQVSGSKKSRKTTKTKRTRTAAVDVARDTLADESEGPDQRPNRVETKPSRHAKPTVAPAPIQEDTKQSKQGHRVAKAIAPSSTDIVVRSPAQPRRSRPREDLFAPSSNPVPLTPPPPPPRMSLAVATHQADTSSALVPATTPSTFESKRASLLARLHQTTPSSSYSPLSPKLQVVPSAFAITSSPISPRWLPTPAAPSTEAAIELPPPPPPPPRHRRPSVTTQAIQQDRQYRHRMLQQDFEKLQASLLANDPKRAKRLARVVRACARAIDTLGALAMYPPEAADDNAILPPQWTPPRQEDGGRVVSGNWFTTEAAGGRRVRRWHPRQRT